MPSLVKLQWIAGKPNSDTHPLPRLDKPNPGLHREGQREAA